MLAPDESDTWNRQPGKKWGPSRTDSHEQRQQDVATVVAGACARTGVQHSELCQLETRVDGNTCRRLCIVSC